MDQAEISEHQKMLTGMESSALTTRSCYFLVYAVLSPLLFYGHLEALVALSLNDNRYTHIVGVPIIAAALVFLRRNSIFRDVGYALWPGATLAVLALSLCWFSNRPAGGLGEIGALPVAAAGIVVAWLAGYIFFFGTRSTKEAVFPLALLALAIPIPPAAVEVVEVLLQQASAEVSHALFGLTSTPFVREGLLFFLPGVTIEVARECSGIRSAIALLITTIVLSNLLLRSGWSRLWLILLAAPIAIFKNAIRIVTLSMLAVHVSQDYLHGDLHHRGGPVFSLLSLALLFPALWALRRWERGGSTGKPGSAIRGALNPSRPTEAGRSL